MKCFNQSYLIGNLCADPELVHVNNKAVTTFRIAVTQNFKKKGAEKPDTDFFPIVCWDHNAEYVAKYLKKGDGIFVCGSLHTRSFVDKNDIKHDITEINADEVSYFDSRKGIKNEENKDDSSSSQESST